MELWSAFLFGLFGSLHCVGMCGPIAISLPLNTSQKTKILIDLLVYNSGRVITYALIGAFVGVFGRFVFYSGYQQQLSIFLGVVILLSVIFYTNSTTFFAQKLGVFKFQQWLTSQFGKFIHKTGKFSLFSIGILNGFLPCGLVYMAVAGAFTNYNILSAMAYMAIFGIGTLPLMLAVSLGGKTFQHKFKIRKLIPIVAFVMGVLFILRGLSLGIPYVSPKIENPNTTEQQIICE